jgi:hypothetical protein
VIAEYEEAIRTAGLQQEGMDLAPLAGLQALRRAAGRSGVGAELVLGDVAYALAVHDGGALKVLRHRRRDREEGEGRRLALEVARAARLGGVEARPRVRVVGPGAAGVLRDLAADGTAAEPGWAIEGGGLPVDAAEISWLGSLFA